MYFTRPEDIAANIQALADYLQQNFPAYYFVAPVTALDGSPMVHIAEMDGGYYRLFTVCKRLTFQGCGKQCRTGI